MTAARAPVQPTILIITALPEERDATLRGLPYHTSQRGGTSDPATYHLSDLELIHAKLRAKVVVACLSSYGTISATAATMKAIESWSPDLVAVIGIAGGVAQNGARLGDILIADQIVDYEIQKITQDGHEHRYRGWPVEGSLLSASNTIVPEEYPQLIGATRPRPGRPVVRFGPVASGSKIIEDEAYLNTLLADWPKLIGCEMEASGVAHASWHQTEPVPFFMVRCVSDLANREKSTGWVGSWRPYAFGTAARYGLRMLQEYIPPSLLKARDQGAHAQGSLVEQKLAARATRAARAGPFLKHGDTLGRGRFEIIEKIGEGNFGAVWRATDHWSPRQVALKVLHRRWQGDQSVVERFEHGAKAMSEFEPHRYIVSVLEPAQNLDGCLCFPMELIEGKTLRDRVPELSLIAGMGILYQVCCAIEYAHSRGVVHRDLNPANILIDKHELVKVIDFDLARFDWSSAGTQTGAVMGTFLFSAPEALGSAKEARTSADIYSLGVLLLYIGLKGQVDQVVRISREFRQRLQTLPLPSHAILAIERATNFSPSARYASVTEFKKDLSSAIWALQTLSDTSAWVMHLDERCKGAYGSAVEKAFLSRSAQSIMAVVTTTLDEVLDFIRSSSDNSPPWKSTPFIDWAGRRAASVESDESVRAAITLLTIRVLLLALSRWVSTWSRVHSSESKWIASLCVVLGIAARSDLTESLISGRYLQEHDAFTKLLRRHSVALELLRGEVAPMLDHGVYGDMLPEERSIVAQRLAAITSLGEPQWYTQLAHEQVEQASVDEVDEFVSEYALEIKNKLSETRTSTAWRNRKDIERWIAAITSPRRQGWFRVSVLERWASFIRHLQSSPTTSWTEPTEIAEVLRMCGKCENHVFFPGSGGNDLDDARALPEGMLEMQVMGSYVCRPIRLTLETFVGDRTLEWSYLFLELGPLPTLDSQRYEPDWADSDLDEPPYSFSEPAWLEGIKDYSYDDGSEDTASTSMRRRVIRLLGGNLVIVAKSSVYNGNRSTYDGRQGARSRRDFRGYIEEIFNELGKHRLLPDINGRIERWDKD